MDLLIGNAKDHLALKLNDNFLSFCDKIDSMLFHDKLLGLEYCGDKHYFLLKNKQEMSFEKHLFESINIRIVYFLLEQEPFTQRTRPNEFGSMTARKGDILP